MPKRNAAPRSSGIFDLLGVAQESPASSGAAAKGQSAKPAAASPEPAAAESGISAIALSALRLDLAQPRRPLPLTYATKVNSGALTLVDAIKKWAADVGLPLTLAFDAETPLAKGAAHALDLLRRELALPIFDVGLINPISVIESGEAQYTVETGERRALAHAYLVACGHAEFERVPAQIVERGEIARRQLEENEARQDLSAVQKARLWWAARYRLSGRGRIDWSKFGETDNVNTVLADETKGELVTWTKVEQQLKRTKQMRIYTLRVLDLPAEAVRIAEEYGLPEKVLRPILERFAGDPAAQLALVREEAARADGGSTSTAKDMARRVTARATPKQTDANASPAAAYRRALGSLDKLTGGKTLAARDIKRLSESLAEDTTIVEAARRLKPLIDKLAG